MQFGPSIGQATDKYGRKAGTIAFALLYSLGCASIKSNTLWMLFAGRAVVGCALSLLFSAPEAWVAGEASRKNITKYLGETFGLAYTGDALVAIIASKLASWAASMRGVTGPFDLSIVFLAAGAVVSGLFWKENKAVAAAASSGNDAKGAAKKGSIKEAFDIVRGDQKLMLVGAVQSLFEAAMYVFILQWPNAVAGAVSAYFGEGAMTPFGTIFSCFMTCSLFGSLTFGKLLKRKNSMTESTATGMLAAAAVSMGAGAYLTAGATTSLAGIMGALCLYEGKFRRHRRWSSPMFSIYDLFDWNLLTKVFPSPVMASKEVKSSKICLFRLISPETEVCATMAGQAASDGRIGGEMTIFWEEVS